MAAAAKDKLVMLLICTFWFASGFFACLLAKGLITPSGWAEALSGISTAVALMLASITYIGWQKQKIREDAYVTKRLYISTLVKMEAITIQIANSVMGLVPAAGMLVPSDSQAKETLEGLVAQHNDLRLQAEALISTASELGFWDAALSDESMIEHERLITGINEYLSSLHYLHNSLMNIYIHKSDDSSTGQWNTRFIAANKTIYDLFNSRKSKSMNMVFMR